MRITALCGLIALAPWREAGAFTLKTTPDGQPIRWESFPVPYEWADTEASAGLPDAPIQTQDAFDAWAEVDETEIAFDPRLPKNEPMVSPDGHNYVWIASSWPFDPNQVALTDLWTDTSGEIVAFDIHINGTVSWATDGRSGSYDLQAALVHEVGHVLGLDHSTTYEASMFPSTELGATWRRALDEDDVRAAQALYTVERPPPPSALQNFFLACNTSQAPAGWLAPLVVASALCRREGR